ncbi:hypothetical protein AGIG_G16664 [Arapaima gigas]
MSWTLSELLVISTVCEKDTVLTPGDLEPLAYCSFPANFWKVHRRTRHVQRGVVRPVCERAERRPGSNRQFQRPSDSAVCYQGPTTQPHGHHGNKGYTTVPSVSIPKPQGPRASSTLNAIPS